MMKRLYYAGISVLVLCPFLFAQQQQARTGLDNILKYQSIFKGKRLGLITNHTAYNREGKHLIDVMAELPDVQITALFGPEHGIRGKEDAGRAIDSGEDSTLQIPVYSLYGKTRKPTAEMLQKVDVLVFDIQDIGARFYTYIWTMALAMEAAAEHGKEFVILDRPNPINGLAVEGNILDTTFSSFVGLFPIPVRHGMTVGELARLFKEEGWLNTERTLKLTVIPMSGWQRSMWFDETGLPFIKPSPNMPDLQTATVYPGICLLEGTNVSEGRGTLTPFMHFGAPWIDADSLAVWLNALSLPGIRFKPTVFTPRSISGMSTYPKYENEICNGVKIVLTDRDKLQPYWTGIRIIETIYQHYPQLLKWRKKHFDRLCGTKAIRNAILQRKDLQALRRRWSVQLDRFKQTREACLLYR
ncbi:MAG TPA: DUF1343 domain-containing protein [Caldithrix abyssi]|uniref:DUF1343 domain-containing protein n=1 Tax=Caldithrix abyssi TaxID=187145 RepID=A0A7V4U2V9_CALAY|nr:DUF1343 domain-containing protein [Caldithrix abyssi]